MHIYPQAANGSVCQFPFTKSLHYRTITNLAEDGSRVVLQDPNASAMTWSLRYSGLTDSELNSLQTFFELMGGRLRYFTFLDPSGNLLTWSEDFTQQSWEKSTFLQIQPGVLDPTGTTRATTINNIGLSDLSITQSIAIPGSCFCNLSMFVRSQSAVNVSLNRGPLTINFTASASWQRISFSGMTDEADSSTFGLLIPAGAQVDIFGAQVQPQPKPSNYIQTFDQAGVYPSTRFDSDSFTFGSEAPNSNSCQVTLYSRLAL